MYIYFDRLLLCLWLVIRVIGRVDRAKCERVSGRERKREHTRERKLLVVVIIRRGRGLTMGDGGEGRNAESGRSAPVVW